MGHSGTGNGFVNIIGAPHGDCLLAGFVGLQREEDRVNNQKPVISKTLLHSEESKNIL